MLNRLTSLLALACAVCAFAEEPAPTKNAPEYIWKTNEIYRFEYHRKITAVQPDENGASEKRETEIAGVLVFETGVTRNSDGTTPALIRFDSARVSIPLLRYYASQIDVPEVHKTRTDAANRALDNALKAVKWSATLHTDGRVKIEKRQPLELSDWLREMEGPPSTRKKLPPAVQQEVKENLNLLTPSAACGLLPTFAPETIGANEAPRPVRTAPKLDLMNGGARARLTYAYALPEKIAPYKLRMRTGKSPDNALMTVGPMKTSGCDAVWDNNAKMLDAAAESYQLNVNYAGGGQTLTQDLKVESRLHRLFPSAAPLPNDFSNVLK